MKFVVLLFGIASAIKVTSDPIPLTPTPVPGPVDHSKEFWKASESGQEGLHPYKRIVPVHFAGEDGPTDIFMRSMHEKYALEGKNVDGSPNGKFWMSPELAKAAAIEVLTNNLNWDKKKRDNHLTLYFEPCWKHFDVTESGVISAVEMSKFVAYLVGEPYIAGLHPQTNK